MRRCDLDGKSSSCQLLIDVACLSFLIWKYVHSEYHVPPQEGLCCVENQYELL
jgi:hypothetical protein